MSVFKIAGRRRNFTIIGNELINDPTLSAKAKGIMLYLLSKPDDWEVRLTDLVEHFSDGDYAIRAGVEELELAGYIVRMQMKGATGRFEGYAYWVHEEPVPQEQRSSPDDRRHNAVSQFPVNGKPQPTNTELTNTEKHGAGAPTPTQEPQTPEPTFEELFPGTGKPPVTSNISPRDLQTQEGRDQALARMLKQRLGRLDEAPWLDLEAVSPVIASYQPPVGVDRDFVLHLVAALVEVGIPLDTKDRSEVRFWLKGAESIGRKTEWDWGTTNAALQAALRSGLSLKGPQSIEYAIADVLRTRTQQHGQPLVAGGDGGVVTVLRKVKTGDPQ